MDKLTYEQQKQILHDICNEECKTHNLDVKIEIVELIRYMTETYAQLFEFKNIKCVLQRFALTTARGGYYPGDETQSKEIVIFHNRKQIFTRIVKQKFIDNIWTCYHELKHAMQYDSDQKNLDFSYEKFFTKISIYCQKKNAYDYKLEHDKYYIEIDADLYAYQKTKEYLMKNYPEEYEREKEYLDLRGKKTKFHQMTFDPSFEIERTLQQLKKGFSDSGKEGVNLEEYSPVLSIFLDKQLKYKPIKNIIKNPEFKKVDKRIVYAFFSSKTFLEQLDYNRLTYEELQILKESLEYTINKYQEQLEIISQEKEMTLDYYLKESKSILGKMRLTSNYYNKYLRRQLNPYRNQFEMIEHERNLPNVLTAVNEQIEHKSNRRGYIAINTFYIVGLLLSISTIIYLLLK